MVCNVAKINFNAKKRDKILRKIKNHSIPCHCIYFLDIRQISFKLNQSWLIELKIGRLSLN